jgi:hypothetical protein
MADETDLPLREALAALARLAKPLELRPHVADRGVPGKERIYMRANQRVSLRGYLLLVGVHLLDETTFPAPNHVLWLGNETLDEGAWLIVYTGPGTPLVSRIVGTNEPARVIYWHSPTTIFHDPRMVPLLVQFEPAFLQFGQPPS